jgi:hypothetical protein
MTEDAAFMKGQPGFISTQLHRAICESPTYLNYAVWESTVAFRAGIFASAVQGEMLGLSILGRCFTAPLPEGAVPGVCVA